MGGSGQAFWGSLQSGGGLLRLCLLGVRTLLRADQGLSQGSIQEGQGKANNRVLGFLESFMRILEGPSGRPWKVARRMSVGG